MEIFKSRIRKQCTGCGEIKYKREFYKRINRKDFPDGYDCRCKECRRKQSQKWRQLHTNKPAGVFLINGKVMERNGNVVKIHWGEEKIKAFKRKFPTTKNEDLAQEFGCGMSTIARRAREYGLVKDPEWLHGVWNENRTVAHAVHRITIKNEDRTAFLEAGKKYQFQKGTPHLTSEQRSENAKKAWITRRRNMRRAKAVNQ